MEVNSVIDKLMLIKGSEPSLDIVLHQAVDTAFSTTSHNSERRTLAAPDFIEEPCTTLHAASARSFSTLLFQLAFELFIEIIVSGIAGNSSWREHEKLPHKMMIFASVHPRDIPAKRVAGKYKVFEAPSYNLASP